MLFKFLTMNTYTSVHTERNAGHTWVIMCERPCYHPQTKFVKVMFSQVSVCPQWGVSAPLHGGIQSPLADTPPGR